MTGCDTTNHHTDLSQQENLVLKMETFEDSLLAAKKGNVEVQLVLGDRYYQGRGVEKNVLEAMKWYGLAAAQGNEKAKEQLVLIKADEDWMVTVNGVSFVMKPVKGGTFLMGKDENEYDESFGPIHTVTLSTFFIGETEVTQGLWKAVMGSEPTQSGGWNDHYGKGDNLPAYNLNWHDCQEFISRLNELTGREFRLPTESEWEFAARGGKESKGFKYAGSNNLNEVGWYWQNSGDRFLQEEDVNWDSEEYGDDDLYSNNCRPHDVKTLSPNELGVYDMSGNVYEWCRDWYSKYNIQPSIDPQGPEKGRGRVLRGGWFQGFPEICHVGFRYNYEPQDRYFNMGFRLAFSEKP